MSRDKYLIHIQDDTELIHLIKHYIDIYFRVQLEPPVHQEIQELLDPL
jgi:hypothetical protein